MDYHGSPDEANWLKWKGLAPRAEVPKTDEPKAA
jgi:hypothetical protein